MTAIVAHCGGPIGNAPPRAQHRHLVAHVHDEPDDMLDQDQRHALLVADPAQEGVELGQAG